MPPAPSTRPEGSASDGGQPTFWAEPAPPSASDSDQAGMFGTAYVPPSMHDMGSGSGSFLRPPVVAGIRPVSAVVPPGHDEGAGPPPDLPPGTRLGNFDVLCVLGRGGMGTVYEAEHRHLRRRVAIKLRHPEAGARPGATERLLAEARAAGRLDHPNAVGVHDVGEWEGGLFIAMELVIGRSADEMLHRHGPLPWPMAVRLGSAVCRGLGAAHALGLVHRDVKPGNILCGDDGSVKLTDFGLTKDLDAGPRGLTREGRVVGTPDYMSPEQACGGAIDGRADQYSLAATLFHLLTGRRPFQEHPSAMEVLAAQLHAPFPDVRTIRPDVPDGLAAVLQRASRKKPAERYPDADSMADELEALLLEVPEAWEADWPGTRKELGGALGNSRGRGRSGSRGAPGAAGFPSAGAPGSRQVATGSGSRQIAAGSGSAAGAGSDLSGDAPASGATASRRQRGQQDASASGARGARTDAAASRAGSDGAAGGKRPDAGASGTRSDAAASGAGASGSGRPGGGGSRPRPASGAGDIPGPAQSDSGASATIRPSGPGSSGVPVLADDSDPGLRCRAERSDTAWGDAGRPTAAATESDGSTGRAAGATAGPSTSSAEGLPRVVPSASGAALINVGSGGAGEVWWYEAGTPALPAGGFSASSSAVRVLTVPPDGAAGGQTVSVTAHAGPGDVGGPGGHEVRSDRRSPRTLRAVVAALLCTASAAIGLWLVLTAARGPGGPDAPGGGDPIAGSVPDTGKSPPPPPADGTRPPVNPGGAEGGVIKPATGTGSKTGTPTDATRGTTPDAPVTKPDDHGNDAAWLVPPLPDGSPHDRGEAVLGRWRFTADRWVGGAFRSDVAASDAVPTFPPQFDVDAPDAALAGLVVHGGRGAWQRLRVSEPLSRARLPRRTLTVEAWVAVDRIEDPTTTLVGCVGPVSEGPRRRMGWSLCVRKQRFLFQIATRRRGELSYLMPQQTLEPGLVHHVVVTYDGDVVHIHMDGGRPAMSRSHGGEILYYEQAALNVGAFADDKDRNDACPGLRLYEVGIYNAAWDQKQIAEAWEVGRGRFGR